MVHLFPHSFAALNNLGISNIVCFDPIGMMEYRNVGILGLEDKMENFPIFCPSIPLFHHSIIPVSFHWVIEFQRQ